MNRWIILLTVCTLLLGGQVSQAQEEDDGPSVEEQMATLVALGPGVHNIQKNKKGNIRAFVVVGQARISTSLGKNKGLELARNKANLACSAEFVKWLKEEVSVYESNDEETVILLEGSEEGDGESLTESGKSVEKSSRKMESLSKGLVRGLQLIHKEVDGDGKTYTIIKGWKADTAEGTKKIAADLASDEPATNNKKSGKTTSPEKSSEAKKKIDKEIESGSTTSDDAADFLAKKKK
jgi:hypothetical protein